MDNTVDSSMAEGSLDNTVDSSMAEGSLDNTVDSSMAGMTSLAFYTAETMRGQFIDFVSAIATIGTDIFDSLSSALGSLDSIYFSSFVLLSDFNVNYFHTNSFLYRQLEYHLLPFSLSQIVTSATHNNPNSSQTLIDLVFLSNSSSLGSCNVIPPLANSDHNGYLSTSSSALLPHSQ